MHQKIDKIDMFFHHCFNVSWGKNQWILIMCVNINVILLALFIFICVVLLVSILWKLQTKNQNVECGVSYRGSDDDLRKIWEMMRECGEERMGGRDRRGREKREERGDVMRKMKETSSGGLIITVSDIN